MKDNVTLAIYPNALGFGYACVENQGALIDYGKIRTRPISNKRLLGRIRKLVDFLEPRLIVLRDPEGRLSKRSQCLVDDIEKEFGTLEIAKYSREQIKFVFAEFNAQTKREIALKLVEKFTELKDRVPQPRKLWMKEHENMAIFDALSLAMTHFYLTE